MHWSKKNEHLIKGDVKHFYYLATKMAFNNSSPDEMLGCQEHYHQQSKLLINLEPFHWHYIDNYLQQCIIYHIQVRFIIYISVHEFCWCDCLSRYLTYRLRGTNLLTYLTLILPWISNYIHCKVWDEVTYPSSNFNDCYIEVWEWISNYIPHITGHVITYPYWD